MASTIRANTIKFGPRAGSAYGTRFTASIEGGPELAAAMKRLEASLQVQAAKAALDAAGQVIADDWKARIPLGPGQLHYREAITVKASKTKKGASGSVRVRKLGGSTPADAEPLLYAHKEEFGGPIAGGGFSVARPAARPAFDSSKGRAVDAAEAVLRAAAEAVAR